jgi:predicted nucleic acid-binding protein
MFDTNIFSNLIAGKIRPDELPADGEYWATNVQREELKNAKDDGLRSRLLSTFKETVEDNATLIPPAFAFNVPGAGFGQGEWRSNSTLWQSLKDDLDAEWEKLPAKKKKSRKKSNNIPDASIAEAAFHNGLILVTSDELLAFVATKHQIQVQYLKVRKANIA